MRLVVTHEQPDFDALASLALARRLHPDARVALPDALPDEVRACLGLYWDRLDPLDAVEASKRPIAELIVVDTADRTRLGPFERHVDEVPLVVYDHHPAPREASALPTGRGIVDRVGATVTLLVRELRRRDDALPAELASLALLGLHQDTGGFSYDLTTPEDHDAASWLLRRGGTLDLVRRFARGTYGEEHQAFRTRMVAKARLEQVAGRPVAVSAFEWPRYLADVSALANELLELHRADAALLAVRMDERTLLFARAAGDTFDVGAALREAASGGGHPGAAFARTRTGLDQATRAALAALARHARPPLRARDLMSTPVRTIPPDATVHEASRLLLRYGHNGLPVVAQPSDGEEAEAVGEVVGEVVGVVSRRDLERALQHGLGRSRVAGFMGTPAVTAEPDATLERLETMVAEHGVGRLPIVQDGRLVGIVTRSDLLEARHGPYAGEDDPVGRIVERVEAQASSALQVLKNALPEGARLYLVGGSVRDALLGASLTDLDLAVEGGRAAPLIDALAAATGRHHTRHDAFGTASVRLPGGLGVDVATAREERYPEPGALPEVVHSDVRRDLARRDFTVNAMALRLTPGPPQLLDPFGGLADLRRGVLRTLHPLSFTEDATRIVRGARLSGRLGFAFDDETGKQARRALAEGRSQTISAERLRSELEATLREPVPSRALAVLEKLGALRAMYGLAHPAEVLVELDALREAGRPVPPAAFLLAMMVPLANDEAAAVVARFHLPSRRSGQVARIRELIAGAEPTDDVLHGLGREGRAVLEAHGRPHRERVRALESLAGRRRLRGRDLLDLGMTPGPEVGRILDEVARARRQGRVDGFGDELDLARRLVARARGQGEPRDL
ncbi:MAG: CBS domain-containing protein [Trueperaceae bacterium]|nr:CBS domain-containing protein [Trueperaceae bacterium]